MYSHEAIKKIKPYSKREPGAMYNQHPHTKKEVGTGPLNVSKQWKGTNMDIVSVCIMPIFFNILLFGDYKQLTLAAYSITPFLLFYWYILYHCLVNPIPRHDFIRKWIYIHSLLDLFIYSFVNITRNDCDDCDTYGNCDTCIAYRVTTMGIIVMLVTNIFLIFFLWKIKKE